MEIDSEHLKQYALFHVNRKITNLYKHLLFVLEDLRLNKYNIQDNKVYQQTRKRILDLGNDAIREIEEHFKQLDINVKAEIIRYKDSNSAETEFTEREKIDGK